MIARYVEAEAELSPIDAEVATLLASQRGLVLIEDNAAEPTPGYSHLRIIARGSDDEMSALIAEQERLQSDRSDPERIRLLSGQAC